MFNYGSDNHDLLWSGVSGEHELAQRQAGLVHAKVSVSQYWPFLSRATNERDFENRLDLTLDRIASIVPEDSLEAVLASLREDFKLSFTAADDKDDDKDDKKGENPFGEKKEDESDDDDSDDDDSDDDKSDDASDDDDDKKSDDDDDDDDKPDFLKKKESAKKDQHKQATNYQPDPNAAWRYHPGYEELRAPVNNGDLQDADGFVQDLAQGEGRSNPVIEQRQLTPGTWTQHDGMPERPMPQSVQRGYQPVASFDKEGFLVVAEEYLPTPHVRVWAKSPNKSYHEVSVVHGPGSLSTINRASSEDEAHRVAQEYAAAHGGLPVFSGDGRKLSSLHVTSGGWYDAAERGEDLDEPDASNQPKCPTCKGEGWAPGRNPNKGESRGGTSDYCPSCYGSGVKQSKTSGFDSQGFLVVADRDHYQEFNWHCPNNESHEPHGYTGDGHYGNQGYKCNGQAQYEPKHEAALRALASEGRGVEGLQDPAPGQPQQHNQFYFQDGSNIGGNDGFPSDPGPEPKENNLEQFYGEVPPVASSGSTTGQVDGQGYSRLSSLRFDADGFVESPNFT